MGISRSKFRRLVAGDGCFKRLYLDPRHNSVADEVYLWRAVLDRALLDLTGKNLRQKSETIKWLDMRNDNFLTVCESALLEADFVYKSMWRISELLREKEHANKTGIRPKRT